MHEQPEISEEQLRACLQNQYGLTLLTIEFLPLGRDYDAGVYRAVNDQGIAYLLKVTTRPLYEPRCIVPRYLYKQGITSVVAPLPTKSNALWTSMGGWTVFVYPFIDGVTNWAGMTNQHWKEVGAIFKRIHQVTLPSVGFESVRKETFDPIEYIQWVRTYEGHHLHESSHESASQKAVHASWIAHQDTIHRVVASLEKLSKVLQRHSGPYVICHADLHANNLIRDHAGRVFVIDWDEVMLAPKERDFIFIRKSYADAFFQGYGQTEINWTTLTYYLWERNVQDLIEYARSACFRKDWGEEARAEAAQSFHDILTKKDSTLSAAYDAAAHLPSDLMVD